MVLSHILFKKKNNTLGWQIVLMFTIEILNTLENIKLLEHFQTMFNGTITYSGRLVRFRVTKLKDLIKIRQFFLTFPQQTSKRIQFEAWCQIQDIMQAGDHQTIKGFETIVALAGSFPKGLSSTLQKAFPHIVPSTPIQFTPSKEPLNGNWIAGFVSADGCFSVLQQKTASNIGYYVKPSMEIIQHKKDIFVLERIQFIIGGSSTLIAEYNNCHRLQFHKRSILINFIIPFFNKYPLYGTKALDFKDFSKVLMIMESGAHQTPKGLDQIKTIVAGMNSKRI